MRFSYWLIGISIGFVILERLVPWRKGQRLFRPGWLRDVGFLALNGHFFSLLTAGLTGWVALQATRLLQDAYAKAPFVRVRTDVLPSTKHVAGTNFCDVAARAAKGKVVLFSALDNLIKGASGQAIQNMNAMLGLPETMGIDMPAIYP